MRVAFAGTPEFALPALAALCDHHSVVGVLTQPDRPKGRGQQLTASAVKRAALERQLPLAQPQTLKNAAGREALESWAPEVLVVVAYGLILPREVLALPPRGCLNIHASLLPRWRGAAPIQRAILAGDAETGVCLMQMEAGLDTGPVLLSESTPIRSDDTGGSLHDRLAEIGAQALAAGLRHVIAGGNLHATPQPEIGATYAHKLEKSEAGLDFSRPAIELERKVRAFDPWPVAEAVLAGERVRVWAASALPATPEHADKSPGAIVSASKLGIDIACGEGVLRILKLQRAGGRVLGTADYLNARSDLRTA